MYRCSLQNLRVSIFERPEKRSREEFKDFGDDPIRKGMPSEQILE